MATFKETLSNIALNLILLSVNSTPNYVKSTTWISSRLKQMFSNSLISFLSYCLENFYFLIFENFRLQIKLLFENVRLQINQIAFPDY